MKKSVYFDTNNKQILEQLLQDIEKQFKKTPFEEISYTISLKLLGQKTGIPRKTVGNVIRKFLGFEKKRYKPKRGSIVGTKYFITVEKREFEKWKEDLETLKKKTSF